MTWDGKENREVWRQDGRGASAVIEAGAGSLLTTCHDADAPVRVTADGRTLQTLRDVDGLPFLSSNGAVVDAAGRGLHLGLENRGRRPADRSRGQARAYVFQLP